jgi:ferredoxin-NADP reductase
MYKTKILNIENVTHDVKRFTLEKPNGYKIEPGYATEVSIDKPGFEDQKRPFTFISLNNHDFLEFTIKRYDSHNGVTKKLHSLVIGDVLNLDDPWKTLEYKNKGVFIAGGAGITPFIAILRHLRALGQIEGNSLIFSNKTSQDVILEQEFKDIFINNPDNLILTLTEEDNDMYDNKRIDKDFLLDKINDFSQDFYICGPPKMGEDIKNILTELGARSESISFE